jgi:hypothetical protein
MAHHPSFIGIGDSPVFKGFHFPEGFIEGGGEVLQVLLGKMNPAGIQGESGLRQVEVV